MTEGTEEECCENPRVKVVVDAAVALANAGVDMMNEGGIEAVVGAKVVCLAEQAAAAVGEELEDVCGEEASPVEKPAKEAAAPSGEPAAPAGGGGEPTA